MIPTISISKLKNQATKNRSYEVGYNHSNKNANANKIGGTFKKSKNISTVSFKGVLDLMANYGNKYRLLHEVDSYVKEEDRSALAYKIQLTPEIFKENIRNARKQKDGILKNYSQLDEEAQHVGQAFQSIINIRNAFKNDFDLALQKYIKMNPVGSKIPVFGAIPQFLSMLSMHFWEKLDCSRCPGDICNKSSEIKNKYWDNGVDKICNDYLKIGSAMLQDIHGHGLKPNIASKLYTVVEKGNTQIRTNLKSILESIKRQDLNMLEIFL